MADDWVFGNPNGRELRLRWAAPLCFRRWDGAEFRFCWWLLLVPRYWWQAIVNRRSWSLWMRRYPGATHRCYCPDGWMFDGRCVIAGFGVVWFYSHFWGDVPCWCDRVSEAVENGTLDELLSQGANDEGAG